MRDAHFALSSAFTRGMHLDLLLSVRKHCQFAEPDTPIETFSCASRVPLVGADVKHVSLERQDQLSCLNASKMIVLQKTKGLLLNWAEFIEH